MVTISISKSPYGDFLDGNLFIDSNKEIIYMTNKSNKPVTITDMYFDSSLYLDYYVISRDGDFDTNNVEVTTPDATYTYSSYYSGFTLQPNDYIAIHVILNDGDVTSKRSVNITVSHIYEY